METISLKKMVFYVHPDMAMHKVVKRQFLKREETLGVYLGDSQPGCSYCNVNDKVAQAQRFYMISYEDRKTAFCC